MPTNTDIMVDAPPQRAGRFARACKSLRPGHQVRSGAVWGASALVIWAVIIGALNVKSGFGLLADFLFAIVIAALGVPLAALVVALLLTILRHAPRLLTGFFTAAFLGISLIWRSAYGYWTTGLLLFMACSLGAALAVILLGGLRHASRPKRISTITVL